MTVLKSALPITRCVLQTCAPGARQEPHSYESWQTKKTYGKHVFLWLHICWNCVGLSWNWSDSGPETPTTPSHLSPGHTCGRSPELLTQRPGPLLWSTQVSSTSLLHSWNLSPSDSTSTNSRLAMSTFLLVVVDCSYDYFS